MEGSFLFQGRVAAVKGGILEDAYFYWFYLKVSRRRLEGGREYGGLDETVTHRV